LLDHSGNILRFRQDFETIFFSGLDGLDHGEKLDKEARDKEEEEAVIRACPECGFSPYTNRCMSCGHEKKRTALIEELEGKMVELELTSNKITHDRGIWNECCSYVRQWGKPETRRQRAWYLYQDVMKATPPSNFIFNETDRLVEVGRKVENTARRATIRWSKRRT
jgi:hypothetical protein